MARGWTVDPTAESCRDWWTEKVMELCAVGGCGNGAARYVEMPYTLGGHAVDLETHLCDYHLGWHDSIPAQE